MFINLNEFVNSTHATKLLTHIELRSACISFDTLVKLEEEKKKLTSEATRAIGRVE